MTRDEIISMAREAGFRTGSIELHSGAPLPFVAPVSATNCLPEVERLVSIAAAAERIDGTPSQCAQFKKENDELRAKIEAMEKRLRLILEEPENTMSNSKALREMVRQARLALEESK